MKIGGARALSPVDFLVYQKQFVLEQQQDGRWPWIDEKYSEAWLAAVRAGERRYKAWHNRYPHYPPKPITPRYPSVTTLAGQIQFVARQRHKGNWPWTDPDYGLAWLKAFSAGERDYGAWHARYPKLPPASTPRSLEPAQRALKLRNQWIIQQFRKGMMPYEIARLCKLSSQRIFQILHDAKVDLSKGGKPEAERRAACTSRAKEQWARPEVRVKRRAGIERRHQRHHAWCAAYSNGERDYTAWLARHNAAQEQSA